ncbi:MAG: MFS transporter [Eubacteriales bacterium]|nr:MFS transporter [Eubacteriales bacterium]
MNEQKKIRSWCLYDFGNSAFATTILAAVLPVYFANVIYTGSDATAVWGIVTAVAMLIIAALAPILGAISDSANSKKKFWTFFMALGCLGTALLMLPGPGDTLMLSLFFVVANIGFSGSLVFYDAFLPHIVSRNKMDKTSAAGYAWGYIGGGILLVVNMVMIINPGAIWGEGDPQYLGTRLSFLSVAVWWLIFSIPMMKNIHEPVLDNTPKKAAAAIKDGFHRIGVTFAHIKQHKELFKFLIAFFLYIDGVGTIIRMATVFSSDPQLGLSNDLEVLTGGVLSITMVMVVGLLITQLVAWPMSFLMGRIGQKYGAKNTIYICIVTYILIATAGTFMFADWNFLVLAALVGTVQGGVQSMSRSLFAHMVSKEKTGEFFGFYGIFEKFAAILGPLLMSLVALITDNVRFSVLAVIPLFIIGGLLLMRVKAPDTRLGKQKT